MFQFHLHSSTISLILKRVEDRNINPRSVILFDYFFIYYKPAGYLPQCFRFEKVTAETVAEIEKSSCIPIRIEICQRSDANSFGAH